MKANTEAVLVLVLGFGLLTLLAAQTPAELQGTWVGLATLEGMAEPNELTLVLTLKNEDITGHITDQYQTMIESPIGNVRLEDGNFHFSAPAAGPGGQEVTLSFVMRIEGDSMRGTFEIPELGMSGAWEANRQDR